LTKAEASKVFGFKKGKLLVAREAGRDHMKEAYALQSMLKEEGIDSKLDMNASPLGPTIILV